MSYKLLWCKNPIGFCLILIQADMIYDLWFMIYMIYGDHSICK